MTPKKNIQNSPNESLNNDELLKYLQEQLSNEDQHEMEKQILDSHFYSDAIEGFEKIKNKKSIPVDVEQLHQSLKKQIQNQKEKNNKRKIKELPFIVLITIIVLLLCVLAFTVVYFTKTIN